MVRYFYAASLGLLGAAMLHLTIIFLLPSLSSNNSWSFIEEYSGLFEPIEIFDTNEDLRQNFMFDPLFRHFACRFDLRDGAVRITASGNTPIWSIAVFDSSGAVFFSANDRIANSPDVDIAIVNQRQLRFARQNTPDTIAASLVAAATSNEGFALFRAFEPDRSWSPDVDGFFESMECSVLEF